MGILADYGFNRPTRQMYGVKEELEILIFAEFEKWENLKQDIVELNISLQDANVPYIKLD